MQHAWGNYAKYAFGHDELMPRSLRGKDPFGGLGATILDSLDTLWIMDMKDEYKQARDWVANDLNFTRYVCVHGCILLSVPIHTMQYHALRSENITVGLAPAGDGFFSMMNSMQ